MALTYIETVRLLMGDLDEGDNNFFTADQWAHLFGTASYDDDAGDSKVSLVEVAIDALRLLSIYHADARPERSKKTDDRVATLSRWPLEQKALYLEDGVPDGIGTADEFPWSSRGDRAARSTWAARISGGPSPSSATVGDQRPAQDFGHRLPANSHSSRGREIHPSTTALDTEARKRPAARHTPSITGWLSARTLSLLRPKRWRARGAATPSARFRCRIGTAPNYFYAGTSLTNQDVTSLDGLS